MTAAPIDWDWLYYLYVVELGRSDDEFWGSPLCRIFALLNCKASIMSNAGKKPREPDVYVNSLKEIPGW